MSKEFNSKKKIFILLPDGVGLRNFAFTSFVEIGEKMGWEVIFWNYTPFDLEELGFNEIRQQDKPRPKTDLLKRAKNQAELNHFQEKFDDPVYQTYRFPPSRKGLKKKIKNGVVAALVRTHKGEKGLRKLRDKMKVSERKGNYYKECKKILETEKPDFIFCTNQRPVTAIAPLTAAEDLKIPSGTFIFSWDNLPKATMVVEPNHFFVWSQHMKNELLTYYPFISTDRIHITGSPQFEPHFDMSLRKTRKEFFRQYKLEVDKEYICFSGDDITTSPHDPLYLQDVATAVKEMNKNGQNLGIIFRRCPTDLSDRYDKVLEKFNNIIFPISPKWEKLGDSWNSILPSKADLELQINTIMHTSLVINVGSSMAFDYAIFDKPCLYLNYDVEEKKDEIWSPKKVYNFVHFRSMPSKKSVIWLNSKEEIGKKIKMSLKDASENVTAAQTWFKKINLHPTDRASERIWNKIEEITQQQTISLHLPERQASSQ